MRRFVISELSMAPALSPGDRFLTRRLRKPGRNQVVFFEHPHRTDFWLVKRIIGLPGEAVSVVDGRVHIDGDPLEDRWGHGHAGSDGSWRTPIGKIFVLSDARESTRADSRSFGPVGIDSAYVSLLRYRRPGYGNK